MCERLLATAVMVLLINLTGAAPLAAKTQSGKEDQRSEKVKVAIARLGTGPKTRVELKLRDGTKIKGYVSEIAADHFVVADSSTGAATTVSYSQVDKVKTNYRSNESKEQAKMAIIGAAAGAAILVLAFVLVRCCDR